MSKVAFLWDLNITFRWFCWVMKPYQLSRSCAQEGQSSPWLKGVSKADICKKHQMFMVAGRLWPAHKLRKM